MSAVLQFNYALETVECAKCFMSFAAASAFLTERRRDHATFYCPQGHSNYFPGQSDLERLRHEIAEKDRSLEFQRNRARQNYERAERTDRQLRATRGVVTRTKNRIAKGKCPKCSTQFLDLAKHMAAKHPEYATAPEDAAAILKKKHA